MAGQYRHAALLSFHSIERWLRNDGDWAGSYFVTKNHFDPSLRVGYQTASQYSNYNGSLMFHLAEAWQARRSNITEHPSPSEIGGYAITTDPAYDSVFANAGGMQMQANLRGETAPTSGNWWTPLGVVRFARTGWDTRLGPSDGALTQVGGVTYAPEFLENGRWLHMADLSKRYQGVWSVQFVHPLIVRCAIEYRPKAGQSGPAFRDEFIITPDGVLSTVKPESPGSTQWGVTWPILENDGAPLERSGGAGRRSVGYRHTLNQQNFLSIEKSEMTEEPLILSTYGDLRPVRVQSPRPEQHTFIYPRHGGDSDPQAVRDSLVLTPDGFRSVLGRISGTIYVGRTAAGGVGKQIHLDGDGVPEVTFSEECGFIIQLESGMPAAIEADRDVDARIGNKVVHLKRHRPQTL